MLYTYATDSLVHPRPPLKPKTRQFKLAVEQSLANTLNKLESTIRKRRGYPRHR